jgi:hypothetical protein
MYAYIYDQPHPSASETALRIGDNRVAFFIAPILENARFRQSHCGNYWEITFFKNSCFQQILGVQLTDSEQDKKCEAKAVWADNKHDVAMNAQLLPPVSWFIRKSTTLQADKIVPLTSTRGLIVDRDAVAYFSDKADQFKRIVLELCLAVAYRRVLEESMARLTASVKARDSEKTLALYEDILHFNAGDFFQHPVIIKNHELFPVWDLLAEHHKLQVFNTELTAQLANVSLLLHEQRERARAQQVLEEQEQRRAQARLRDEQEQKREKAFSRRSTWLGIVLAGLSLFSLLSLVELTPQHFESAYRNWVEPYVPTISADAEIRTQ